MSVKTEINIENKPKATMKNFQFVENLDKLIDVAEKKEEGNEPLEDNRRSFYDLVMIRSRYIDRYDWYDTDIRWDYGFQGGAGFALVFSPIEISVGAQLRYGLSSIFTPDSQFPEGSGYEDRNQYYYRFAYPLDIMITFGMHFELGKRYGKTRKALKQEAYDIVYGNPQQQ